MTKLSRHKAAIGRLVPYLLVVVAGVGSYAYVSQTAGDASDSAASAETAAQQAKAASRKNDRAIARINAARREARDQGCKIDERQHKEELRQLRETYKLLEAQGPEAIAADPVLSYVVANLDRQEREAKLDRAPEYCDEPGVKAERLFKRTNGQQGAPPVGLPEPDPKIPERPAALR